ncbi:MAG: tRNA (N6-isopentenyl adenosine(37)-C2)-methylthiotransferase MiaB [Candidatus Velthaea sp.]|jgi:tRNA-2-methylthio-N6-dimethylallyladenosine synthase
MAAIYIETHGCQMNEADSQYIAGRAASAGYTVAEKPEDACVLLLNTCTVRDNAETRAYGRIGQWKAMKLADPRVKIVVAGCLAEQDRERMRTLAPHVDAIFGTKELRRLGDALAAWRDDFGDDDTTLARELRAPLGGVGEGVAGPYAFLRAFVNVQRGCSYYCTFCIVPHVRGRFDHRPAAEIVAEVRRNVAAGAREITLVGQTVNAYQEPATGADFAGLCAQVAAIPGVERLAFVTSHPKDLNERLARALAAIPQMNPRFHLAVQSASNAMLRRMNRKYTIEEYRERVGMFLAHNPGWAMTTDMIVGFPGETEADFEQTLALAETGMFAQAYMFVYSPRRGTPASHWPQVDAAVAGARLKRLAAAQNAACRAYHDRKIGTTVRALITGPSRKDATMLSAKTTDNVTVVFPTVEVAPTPAQPWVDVRIESAFVWGVKGTAIGRCARWDEQARPVTTLARERFVDLLEHC